MSGQMPPFARVAAIMEADSHVTSTEHICIKREIWQDETSMKQDCQGLDNDPAFTMTAMQ